MEMPWISLATIVPAAFALLTDCGSIPESATTKLISCAVEIEEYLWISRVRDDGDPVLEF
jgi:hypothetical protein